MEPITTALAGISLFKAAVDGIKSAIGTANDVSDIAHYIDNLFEGEKQVQHKRSAKSGVGVADQFGVKSVASEVIDARLAKEQMQEIASLVDMRFGHGTWRSIVEERARRIQAAKEAAAEAKRKKIQEVIDLHGIRHKEALERVKDELSYRSEQGSFSLTIITGNSSVLQKRIFEEILEGSMYTYYIPSWNLGQIIVERTVF